MSYSDTAGPAVRAVARAIRVGALVRLPCVVCGGNVVEAHHPNGYDDEHALDVRWLCRTHHAALHHPQLFTIPEAAKLLSLAASTLRHQIKNGKLTARKVSRDWYVTSEEIERYRTVHRRPEPTTESVV